jgi:1-acyl-sn-glycerol-3-phosphate acyltransferase
VLRNRIGSAYLRLSGWRLEGERPTEKKFVVIATPHTSNWDGAALLALAESIGQPLSWMVKSDLVRGPGAVLKHVGAIPIDRGGSHDVVAQMIEEFRRRDELVLVIPPEGTRGRAEYWKSGFYHIARGADVPVRLGYLDFARKRGSFGPAMRLTGDVRADMDHIRAFYARQRPVACYPANVGPIRLREEADGYGSSQK